MSEEDFMGFFSMVSECCGQSKETRVLKNLVQHRFEKTAAVGRSFLVTERLFASLELRFSCGKKIWQLLPLRPPEDDPVVLVPF